MLRSAGTASTSGHALYGAPNAARPTRAQFRRACRTSRRKCLRRLADPAKSLGNMGVEGDALALAQAIDSFDATRMSADLNGESAHVMDLHPVLSQSALLRQLTASADAAACLALFLEMAEKGGHMMLLTESDCLSLMAAAVDRGNVALAQSIYGAMARSSKGPAPVPLPGVGAAAASAGAGAPGAVAGGAGWPPATLKSTELMVLLLARELRVSDALAVIAQIRSRGLPSSDEVPFGLVIDSPLAPGKPLTVVLPQEGASLVACASSRFELETFSGMVSEVKTEALNAEQNPIVRFILRRQPCQAVHEMVVRAPDGVARGFRVGTATPDVPAQVGERVTVVSSPMDGAKLRKGGFLSSRPPGTRPGEPLSVVNHATGAQTPALRPPTDSAGLPTWLLPLVAVMAAGDLGSGLLDPAYPLLLAGGAATAVSAVAGGSTFLVPRWKQLPDNTLAAEEMKQTLLSQHSSLMSKMRRLSARLSEDVMALARLWQLQAKMQSVGAAASYDTRLSRVVRARGQLEDATCKALALLESYSKIANMIEIEVEMNVAVPKSEVRNIERQIAELSEAEQMQQSWQAQVEAEDELERLLRQ